tara:strand:- start:336 stop:665 length:330 start_codon:yes stop_codon:yes gene_type:complete
MLLSSNFIQRGCNACIENFKRKRKNRFATRNPTKQTVKQIDSMAIAVLALLLFIMEIYLIVFLLSRTFSEDKPSSERTVKIILIVLFPEIYALFYIFLRKNKGKSIAFT